MYNSGPAGVWVWQTRIRVHGGGGQRGDDAYAHNVILSWYYTLFFLFFILSFCFSSFFRVSFGRKKRERFSTQASSCLNLIFVPVSAQPCCTIYTSFSSPTNRDVPGTALNFYFPPIHAPFWPSSPVTDERRAAAGNGQGRKAWELLVCTRLAGSGSTESDILRYQFLFLFFFFFFHPSVFSPLKEPTVCFRFRPRSSVRFLQCSSQERERFVFLF